MQPRIKKGDTAMVISGKYKGKKGKVIKVIPTDGKAIVEKINIVKKHQKPTRTFAGGIIEKLAPMQLCKLMLVCPHCSKPTRLSKKDGVRICKKCGDSVDKVK